MEFDARSQAASDEPEWELADEELDRSPSGATCYTPMACCCSGSR